MTAEVFFSVFISLESIMPVAVSARFLPVWTGIEKAPNSLEFGALALRSL